MVGKRVVGKRGASHDDDDDDDGGGNDHHIDHDDHYNIWSMGGRPGIVFVSFC